MKTVAIILIAVVFSSCSKKKSDDVPQQHSQPYLPPTETRLDTSGAYLSPSDLFRDNSSFDPAAFRTRPVVFHGERELSYDIITHALKNKQDSVKIVVEYLSGSVVNSSGEQSATEKIRTVSRLLFYVNNALSYRKALPVETDGADYFSMVRSFDRTFYDAGPAKAIIHYWIDEKGYGGQFSTVDRREYQSVGINKEGIVGALTGYFHRVSNNISAVRFLREDKVSASVVPDPRYRNVAVDVTIVIDWTSNTTSLEIPSDTVFIITNTPDRFFSNRTKLFAQSAGNSVLKELNLRRSTRAQMAKMFAPSLLAPDNIDRDRIFVQFNSINKGWIDYKTMVGEKIVTGQ